MYYKTPETNGYLATVKRFRIGIIAFYTLLALLLITTLRPEFVTSDEQCWLEGSKEYKKTEAKSYTTNYVAYLRIDIDVFDESVKKQLHLLQHELEALKGVEQVDSIFSSRYIYEDMESKESSLVKALPVEAFNAVELKAFVAEFDAPYRHFVNDDFTHFNYYIYSDEPVDIASIKIPFEHHYSEPEEDVSLTTYGFYIFLIIIAIVTLFRLIFNNFLSSIIAMIIIALTISITFAVMNLVTGIDRIHIAMSLIIVSIALVDYLYFYMRWHVSYLNNSAEHALEKMLNRNLIPAFWTSIITVIGLGSLVLIDSHMVVSLSLSVILASTVTYLLNLTLLPALLSYFTVSKPEICIGKYCLLCANGEINFNQLHLKLFIAATIVVTTIGAYKVVFSAEELFLEHVDNTLITVNVPYEEIDIELVNQLDRFELELKAANTGVRDVNSVATLLHRIDAANTQNGELDDQRLWQALFFLELYDLEQELYDEEVLKVSIRIENANRTQLIKWIEQYEALPIYFTDMDTLLSSAKIDKKILLGLSLLTALLIIGAMMGWIFRSKEMALTGFIVNAVPIAWFGLFIELLDISLSIEVLIAMIITVALASDATIHFTYKYYRNRNIGRPIKESLEGMLFYGGIPVAIGSMILAVVFAMLTFTQVPSLQLIGGFGAVLILISLLTDIFVLPVLLMLFDRFESKLKKSEPES